MEPARPPSINLSVGVAFAGAVTAIAAVGLCIWLGAAAEWPLVIAVLGSELCQLIAWPARRLLVGKVRALPKTRLLLTFLASRIALLIAAVILLVGTIVAYALGIDGRVVVLRSLVGIMLITAATGMLGGAAINTAVLLRHWRKHERS